MDSNKSLYIPNYIKKILPYQAGKPIEELAREFNINVKDIIKLASNENPLGMSEKVKKAIEKYVSVVSRYPDANAFNLKVSLSEKYNVPMECLILGNGSNDILEMISMTFLDRSSSAIYSEYSFAVYKLATQARGARHIVVPSLNYGNNLEAMFYSIEPDTRLIFIANPNNPTGTFVNSEIIINFLDNVWKKYGKSVLVILDEAYSEYIDDNLCFNSFELIDLYPNLIICRTFSKAYGLAGLRVGFAIADKDIIGFLNRIRQPFNVNSLAQIAAITALEDDEFLEKSRLLNNIEKKKLYKAFENLDLEYVTSYGNFILVRVGDAKSINYKLLKLGVIVRPVDSYNLSEWLRVTIGLPSENDFFIKSLREIIR
ncbi:histidinol-phosphate aminotransferase [Candidatus Kinetoplastibacterium blastocrithidii TCC012E]|uniref:Histidinol-phosphate aminotransferase n=1 Tax=Candidatus Kinetoplastidibacterium blastocrithidiae TCC012E TaxID=1208922 RepID=M1M0Q2_9PROT|nr:histidinol-phosphate transaminase [Candidatus Kinetoplastibacterium blastocrithidii]AFZ83733.1 histidinol-phosphate aminotransferase [Candidatus Kinetoplastibacterium blastocrithidii (ex Strigomonas culicis)]AGF49856.1 histidinol-phosphate aminotransferase [Candidatus Kinetoplastibacterium blastocrithidii TCC012E]